MATVTVTKNSASLNTLRCVCRLFTDLDVACLIGSFHQDKRNAKSSQSGSTFSSSPVREVAVGVEQVAEWDFKNQNPPDSDDELERASDREAEPVPPAKKQKLIYRCAVGQAKRKAGSETSVSDSPPGSEADVEDDIVNGDRELKRPRIPNAAAVVATVPQLQTPTVAAVPFVAAPAAEAPAAELPLDNVKGLNSGSGVAGGDPSHKSDAEPSGLAEMGKDPSDGSDSETRSERNSAKESSPVKLLKERAAQGDPVAQHQLGALFQWAVKAWVIRVRYCAPQPENP